MGLSDIVNVQIRIASPVASQESFNNLLLVGLGPDAAGATKPKRVTVYSDLKSVKDAGYTINHSIYKAAAVAFSQNPQPTVLYVGLRDVINGTPENITTVMDDALNTLGWYAWSIPNGTTDDLQAGMEWTEANEKLFGFTWTTQTCPVTGGDAFYRTHGHYSSNPYFDVGLAIVALGYLPGQETWDLKTVAAVSADNLTANEMRLLRDANMGYYVKYAGRAVSQVGKTLAGEWIDVIRFRDWLQNDMQIRIFNILLKYPKIPYTNQGIAKIENQMIASLKQGQKQDGVAPDEFDSEGNLVPGFIVTVPNATEVPDTDKVSRVLNGCIFNARLAGAIQAVNVSGNLVYSYD